MRISCPQKYRIFSCEVEINRHLGCDKCTVSQPVNQGHVCMLAMPYVHACQCHKQADQYAPLVNTSTDCISSCAKSISIQSLHTK